MIRPTYRSVKNAEVYARRLQENLGKLSIDSVRAVDVSRMVTGYIREAPIAAMRMLGLARQFFGWCVGIGYLERSPITDVRARAFGVAELPRKRILTDDEIRGLWNADDLKHLPLLRFLLLTGLRIGEAQAARLEWLTADGWLHLPAATMKNAKPHSAYLSETARAQIETGAAPLLFQKVTPTAVQAAPTPMAGSPRHRSALDAA